MTSGPTILALETDSAWVVILAVSLVTFVAVGVLQRVIRRPGGLASGALLILPLVLPLVAAFAYQQAALPEISVLQPAGSALFEGSENLRHLLLVANDHGKGFTLYALAGSAGPWVVLIGLLVTSFMLLRRLVGRIVLRRLVAGSHPPNGGADPDPRELVAEMARRAGLRTAPGVLILPRGSAGAFATGGKRPRILLAEELMESMERAELEAVIAHEIAHIKARDVPLVATAGFLRDLVAWNPFAHFAYWRLARNREFEADRRAAELTRDPLAVASSLVKMCELMKRSSSPRRAALAFLRPGKRIKRRVSALLDLSDGGVGALTSPGSLPYVVAGLLAVVLGFQAAARVTSSEGAWAIMFGSPRSIEAERWNGVGSFDTFRGQATKQGKVVSREAGVEPKANPAARTPFSQVAITVRKPDLPELKKELRLAARRRGGTTPLLFSRTSPEYEAVPVLSDADGGLGLWRLRQLP